MVYRYSYNEMYWFSGPEWHQHMFSFTCNRSMGIRARIDINKWPGSHGTINIPGIKTTLSKHCCLLVCYLKLMKKNQRNKNVLFTKKLATASKKYYQFNYKLIIPLNLNYFLRQLFQFIKIEQKFCKIIFHTIQGFLINWSKKKNTDTLFGGLTLSI